MQDCWCCNLDDLVKGAVVAGNLIIIQCNLSPAGRGWQPKQREPPALAPGCCSVPKGFCCSFADAEPPARYATLGGSWTGVEISCVMDFLLGDASFLFSRQLVWDMIISITVKPA